jgi:putative cardiolipin synthase
MVKFLFRCRHRLSVSVAGWLLAASVLPLGGCALPSLQGRADTAAIHDTDATPLARAIAPSLRANQGKSGVHSLSAAEEAFAVRARLAAAAERSIDVQYYMWHGDTTGMLLFETLCQAAQRGVRVRLLLDDNNTAGLDRTIAQLAAQPNIQVRLFNPLINRRVRWTNYVFDFPRINHRMHNKSFTVDNQLTVIGGRNIGDEYFNANDNLEFVDVDLLAMGPVVDEVSRLFDQFWNSASAYPAEMIVGNASPAEAAAQLQRAFAAARADPKAVRYLQMMHGNPLTDELTDHGLDFEWSNVRLVGDDPQKVFAANRELLLLPRLFETTGPPNARFDLVSPYFVPTKLGTVSFQAMARRQVQVRVLTNSLASNDVAAVHVGYAKRRKALLRAGVRLFELKRVDSAARPRGRGSSAGSLHAKTFEIDDRQLFIGSFNFDPRSARLNTEMGMVVESAAMSQGLRQYFDTRMPLTAYEVKLSSDGRKLQWIETTADGQKVLDSEPGVGLFRRALVGFLSFLPIDWLL